MAAATIRVSVAAFYKKCMHQFPHSAIQHLRRYIGHGPQPRASGYLNKFPVNSAGTHGLIVDKDNPQQQYLFHVDSLRYESIGINGPPTLRRYQCLEFDIVGSKAKNITAPCRQLLPSDDMYTHANTDLHETSASKQQRLSHLIDASSSSSSPQRFTGVVHSVHRHTHNGFIMPDRMNCALIYFDASEVHSTGSTRLAPNDQVSFYVMDASAIKPAMASLYKHRADIALCIRRPDAGLITVEEWEVGAHRRCLGVAYTVQDSVAKLASSSSSSHDRQPRLHGYVIHTAMHGLMGYILCADLLEHTTTECALVAVHVDDCHMFGNRKLRRFQAVEFDLQPNASHQRCVHKAVDVTAPNWTVMRFNCDTHCRLMLKQKRFSHENAEQEQRRFQGIISNVFRRNEHHRKQYEITPNAHGYECLVADENEFRATDHVQLQIGDAVEFHVDGDTQKPFHITAEGGWPLICHFTNDEYTRYLWTKLKLSSHREDFQTFGEDQGTGFISFVDEKRSIGCIEIFAENDVRYKQIPFHVSDCNLKRVRHQMVSFDAVAMGEISGTYNLEFAPFQRKDYVDITRKAVNVMLWKGHITQPALVVNGSPKTKTDKKSEKHDKIVQIYQTIRERQSFLKL